MARTLVGPDLRRLILVGLLGAVLCVVSCGTESKAKITATPNPVPAGPQSFGSTTVSWTTGDGSDGVVYVVVNGDPPKSFANGGTGSQNAPWIGAGGVYEFRLYSGPDRSKLLASVKVERK